MSEQEIYQQIISIAKKYNVSKVVLFGSRARKTNMPKSDIDLAIYGCVDFDELCFDLEENVETLLEFDIIDMENINSSSELIQEIQRDGVVLYEKI